MQSIIKIKLHEQELVLKGENYDNNLSLVLRDIIILKEQMFKEESYTFKHNHFYFKDYEVLFYNVADQNCNIIVDLVNETVELDYMLETFQSFNEYQEYNDPIIMNEDKYYIKNAQKNIEIKEMAEEDYKIMMHLNNKTLVTFKEMKEFCDSMIRYTQSNTDTYYFHNVIIHFNFNKTFDILPF